MANKKPTAQDEPENDMSEYDDSELFENMPDETPDTDEQQALQYSQNLLALLEKTLPSLSDMPSWDMAMFQSSQSELLEQCVEALHQVLQVVRTTTVTSEDDGRQFMVDIIQLCDSIPTYALGVIMVKYHIRSRRPSA